VVAFRIAKAEKSHIIAETLVKGETILPGLCLKVKARNKLELEDYLCCTFYHHATPRDANEEKGIIKIMKK